MAFRLEAPSFRLRAFRRKAAVLCHDESRLATVRIENGSFETNLDALNIGLPGPFSGMLLAGLADWRRANLLSFSNQGALMQLGKWPIARHAREQYD